MTVEAIRDFLEQHPDGILVRMIDGTEYRVPHRDYVSFGPLRDIKGKPRVRFPTSFVVYDLNEHLRMRLVNAVLVAEVVPLEHRRNGGNGKRGKKRSR